jgi:hypothetical protein
VRERDARPTCTVVCHALLDGKYRLQPRGKIDVKGKGEMETWLLEGELDRAAVA